MNSTDSGQPVDATVDSTYVDVDTTLYPDEGIEEASAAQQPCTGVYNVPIGTGSAAARACLEYAYCESGDASELYGIYDTCHALSCDWGVSCTDGLTYCLPVNLQGSLEYGDLNCVEEVVLVGVDSSGGPVTPYAGVPSALDSGAGCVDTYLVGQPLRCLPNLGCITYYNAPQGCMQDVFAFNHSSWFYLGALVTDSAQFTAQ